MSPLLADFYWRAAYPDTYSRSLWPNTTCQVLMAGAFEEGRLRGALGDVLHAADGVDCRVGDRSELVDALNTWRAPTLEEGER